MRLLVDDVLRGAGVEISVALELEKKVQAVDEEQDDAGDAADDQRLVVGNVVVIEGRVERSGQQKTHDGQGKHDAAHLCGGAVVDLQDVLVEHYQRYWRILTCS